LFCRAAEGAAATSKNSSNVGQSFIENDAGKEMAAPQLYTSAQGWAYSLEWSVAS
jgi:hypothetical protein